MDALLAVPVGPLYTCFPPLNLVGSKLMLPISLPLPGQNIIKALTPSESDYITITSGCKPRPSRFLNRATIE